MKKVFAFTFFLVMLAVFCLYAIIAIRPSDSGSMKLLETEQAAPVYPLESTDLQQLSRSFEHVFPSLPYNAVRGNVYTRENQGINARCLAIEYPQAVVSCVWPANAAPLLLHPDLTVLSLWTEDRRRFDILSMPAIYAENDMKRCLYFSDESAAYSIYSDSMQRDEFLFLATKLTWFR